MSSKAADYGVQRTAFGRPFQAAGLETDSKGAVAQCA